MPGNPRSSGYDRNENDWYQETPRAAEALFRSVRFAGAIHDPACGEGNIPRAAMAAGYKATGADIVDRGYGEVRDFMSDDRIYDNIVTNPPFGIGETFTLHAIEHTTGQVAILQRLAWLEGTARHARLFSRGYLQQVLAFSSRISMPPGGKGIPARNGSVAYAWFVFAKFPRRIAPELGWLP